MFCQSSFLQQNRHLSLWPQTIAMQEEQWFLGNPLGTTRLLKRWWCSLGHMCLISQGTTCFIQPVLCCKLSDFRGKQNEMFVNVFRAVLHKIFDEVRLVDVLDSGDTAHLAMMKRPDLGVTFTKLHCWTLTHYSKCVFMDADTLVSSHHDFEPAG